MFQEFFNFWNLEIWEDLSALVLSDPNLLMVISSFLKLLRSVVSAKVIVTASTSADGAIIKVTTSGYCSIVKVAISAEVPYALCPQLVVYCKGCDLCWLWLWPQLICFGKNWEFHWLWSCKGFNLSWFDIVKAATSAVCDVVRAVTPVGLVW
jgi:hypothetical protein